MIRKFFLLTVPMLMSVAMQAQDIRTLFIDMPDSIMPAITRSMRMDFIDYMDSGMKARDRNKLGGVSSMTAFSERALTVMTSASGRLDMVLFDRRKGGPLICLVHTAVTEYEDSHLSFYNADWTPVNADKLIELPQLPDYLTKTALKNDSLSQFMESSLLRFQTATAVDNGLIFRYSSLDAIGPGYEKYQSWIKPELFYKWNGKRFRLK